VTRIQIIAGEQINRTHIALNTHEKMNKLIRTIELKNEKAVVFGIDNSRSNLWILMHFKDLKIKSKKICYQINNGVHQRKNTIHPKRWLKKNFKNTLELLEYINKQPYDIHYLEIEFENGWKLKDQSNAWVLFETTKKTERNYIIDKMLMLAGFNSVDTNELKLKEVYLFQIMGGVVKID
tara:strand:+ start:570 stop:1109 length:540 start_codon:yes stop_codon:yes gene_type:complete